MNKPAWAKFLGSRDPHEGLVVTPLGGGSLAVRSDGAMFLVDPFFTEGTSTEWVRRDPPLLRPQDVDRCDAILITHEHEDHCDPCSSLPIAGRTSAVVMGPSPCVARLTAAASECGANVTLQVVMAGGRFALIDCAIDVIPVVDPWAVEAVGYAIRAQEGSILLLGDALLDSRSCVALLDKWRPDAVFVALGANPPGATYYLSSPDLASVARAASPAIVVPIHWDLWTKTFLDPRSFAHEMPANVRILDRGEPLAIPTSATLAGGTAL